MGGYYDPKRFGNCDHIVTCTEDIRRFVVEEKGRDADRVHHINTFALLEDDAAVGRADFDLPDDAVVLLSLSRLHEKKGIDVLLKALAGLDPRYVLLIAGEGELRAEFEALSERLGVAPRVRFLGWRTDRNALLDLADICVLPSRYEPFGTVVVEAWQTSTPIIAARAIGPANSITHGADGLLCDIDDVTGLRAQIDACQTDSARRDAMIEAGLENVRRTYNEAAVAAKFLALYEGILA
jgi:glycosyltransferase involved in cell wall biosynthesis